MSDVMTTTTTSSRTLLTVGALVRLHGTRAWDADPSATEPTSVADDRLRRRELFLHHLELERQRRRRRTA
jgi:hypothetical protein